MRSPMSKGIIILAKRLKRPKGEVQITEGK